MIKGDGHVIHFPNPKGKARIATISIHVDICYAVQASLSANTFAISGNCEEKRKLLDMPSPIWHTQLILCSSAALTELLPGIFNQLVSVSF